MTTRLDILSKRDVFKVFIPPEPNSHFLRLPKLDSLSQAL
jgi:hypothetical protein